ncbi:MAG: DEAD/DEAH box helicase [Bacteroidota bacterium]
MTFEELNLNTPILRALTELEFINPSPIQAQSVPIVMSGRDVVGIAQTGTGKTFAYLLPILRLLKFSEQKNPRVLILVPTRELVTQVIAEIEKLTKYMTVRVGGIYGGTNINTQKKLVFNGLDILVATPGRLIDLASIGSLKLTSIQKLVIDEVDEMLEQEFRAQLTMILDLLPKKRQNILFSATLTREVEKIFTQFFNNPIKIEIAAHGTPLEKIIQKAYHVPNFVTKLNLLENLLKTDTTMTKVLVFASTIKQADRLFEQLEKKFPEEVGVIHSRNSQNNRFAALEKFASGKSMVLIATDVAARGLDISDVTHVINFDTPDISGDYIHRIGRTGRAGKIGAAITFINKIEEEYFDAIEELMKIKIPIEKLPKEIEVSKVFSEFEKPITTGKNYLKAVAKKKTVDVVQEKKLKNQKINLGGSHKKNPPKTKTRNRGVERNRAKKRNG